MAKPIEYSRDALKVLRRIDRRTASRIIAKIEQLAENSAAFANNVRMLRGGEDADAPLMRLRVGDWRVIYRDHLVLLVINVAPRGSAYE